MFRHGEPANEIKKLLASVALFPERAHLVGAYSLGKAQRVIALLRAAGYDAPIYLHGAMEKITRYYQSRGVALGELRPVKGMAIPAARFSVIGSRSGAASSPIPATPSGPKR